MSDERLPPMPDRPLLDTYRQRYLRLGGRILVVTVIVGLAGGYVGARAWDAAQRAGAAGAAADAGGNGGDGGGAVATEGVDPEVLEWDWDGEYSGSGDFNLGTFEDVFVQIEEDSLKGQGRFDGTVQGYTAAGTVSIDGTVADDGTVSGSITGSVPASRGYIHGSAAVDAPFTGKVDGTNLQIDFSGYAADVNIYGSILLPKSGQAPDRNW